MVISNVKNFKIQFYSFRNNLDIFPLEKNKISKYILFTKVGF